MAWSGTLITILGQVDDPGGNATALADVLALVLMVLGVLILSIFLVMSVRGKIARRNAATPSPREQIDRIKAGAAGRGDAQSARAELLETAQRLAAQLDAKTERLQSLLAEAEARVAELRSAIEMRPAPADEPIAASEGVESVAPPDEPADPLTASVYQLADAGRGPVEIAQELDEQIGKVELILALRGDAV